MSVFYVGITDISWFSLLRDDYINGKVNKYVNFWKPGTNEFRAIKKGDLFLFKLHNKKGTIENGKIVGGAYFSHFERNSISEAWNKYGRGNGKASFESFQNSLNLMHNRIKLQSEDLFGCIILKDVFFFEDWIDEPENWRKSIVSGKKYSTEDIIGKELFNDVSKHMQEGLKTDEEIIEEVEKVQIEGLDRQAYVKVRINQSVFRKRLLRKYCGCCLCNIKNSSLLRASHIKPWAECEPTEKLDVDNGLLLCPNHDALFDSGCISFDDSGRIIISNNISQNDCKILGISNSICISLSDRSKKYMKYHRENVFKY